MLQDFMGMSHVSNQGPKTNSRKKMVQLWMESEKKHWGERNFETNRTYHPLWSLHASLFQSAQCSAPIHCLLCTTSHQAALVALSLMDAFGWWILMNLSNTNDMSSAPKMIHVQNELCPDVQYYMKVTKSVIHLIPQHYSSFGSSYQKRCSMWSMKRSFASVS